jgi:hypothetical protein
MATDINNTNINPNISLNPSPSSNTSSKSNITISNIKAPSKTNTNSNASGTKRKIPNTLIIYLKTRIANYYKINFDPSMLVPKVNSHTVYIDPLVKYTKSAIRDLPNDAPKEILLTQFFLPNQFDSLINRILSGFLSMQSKRTLEEAKSEGVIDNNIELTLDTLFRRNNVFYINNRPYTIVGNSWNKGDWEIDTKPVEKLITPFAPLKGDELESAEKELNDLGAGVRVGNAAAAGKKAENMDTKTTDIPPTNESPKYPETPEEMEAEEQKTQILSATDKKLLDDKLIPDALYILKDGLVKNDPIGYEAADNKMNPASPLTFLFLIDEKQIMQFIEEQKTTSQSGIDVYNNYIRTKTEVINETSVFFDLVMFEFGIKKKEFDTLLDTFNKNIIGLKESQPKIDFNAVKKQTEAVNAKKREYMKSLYDLSKALLNIFDKQQTYFESLVALLEFTKTNYKQIIKYTRSQEPTLAYQCIDLDIQIYSSLTAKNIQNRNMMRRNGQPIPSADPDIILYADAYSKTIADYKKKHSEWFSAAFLSQYVSGQGTRINTDSEIAKYKEDPCLIDVEHSQYTIYMFIIMLYAFINQSDIWRVYYGPISSFISKIQQEAQTKLDATKAKMDSYDEFVKNPRKRAISEDEVLGDIKEKQETKTKAKKSTKLQLTEQEQQYFDLTEAKIESCEYITLYINSLELLCLRKNSLYISDENVNQIYIEISDNSDKYYQHIQECFLKPSTALSASRTTITLPKAIMWATDSINTKPTIEARIRSNDALKTLYISKKNAIKHSIDDLETYCEQIYKLISPVIDANGMKQQCADLLAKDPKLFLKMPQYVPRLQKWIMNELKEYDEQTSNELNIQCKKIGSIYKRQGFKFTTSYQDWIALKIDADLSELDKEHYNDIYSIIKKLNGQSATANASGTASSFNPVLIVFELANPEQSSNDIKKGDYVSDNENKGESKIYKVDSIDTAASTATIIDITEPTIQITGKKISELSKYLSITLDCSKMQSAASPVEAPKFLFFVKTQLDPDTIQGLIPSLDDSPIVKKQAKYELVFNHSKLDNKLVYTVDDIPEDIVMFISQQCAGPDLNQTILKRAQKLEADKKSSKPIVIDQREQLLQLEQYTDEQIDLSEQKDEIEKEVEIADTCLQKISGDYYKKDYEGKTLYQYLVEGDDDDITEFLHSLEDNYNKFLNDDEGKDQEEKDVIEKRKEASTAIEKLEEDLEAKRAEKRKETKKKQKDKLIDEESKLSRQIASKEKERDYYIKLLTYANKTLSGGDKLYATIIEKYKTYFDSATTTADRTKLTQEINKILTNQPKNADKGKIKETLETELDRATFSATIYTFRTEVGKYKEFLEGKMKKIDDEFETIGKQITQLEKELKDDEVNVKESEKEYTIQRVPVIEISKMENKFELDIEEKKVKNMLKKINDVLNKTKSPDLREKYTKYKSEYDAKLTEIANRRTQIEKGKKEIIEQSKKERQKGYVEEEEEPVKVGGGPSDDYYSQGNVNAENQYNPYAQMVVPPYAQQPVPYGLPYGSQPVPYGQPYGSQPVPYGQPYGSQPVPYGQPYNPQAQLMNLNQYSHSNRALELTSKLAYYVSVELELYPGKDVNTIQMAAVKCSSTFERIREAWADMMGYQYRPSTMSESYTYQNLEQKPNEMRPNEMRPNEMRPNEMRPNRNPNTNPNLETEYRQRARGGSVKHRKKGRKGKKRSVSCKIYKQ